MQNKIFPETFVAQIKVLFGDICANRLLSGLSEEPVVSYRHNPAKRKRKDEGNRVSWCEEGRYLSERPLFTLDPHFHSGAYYVQEASSMFIEQAYRCLPNMPLRALDLCAAPGGKTTLWRSLLPQEAWLVANEPIYSRAMILAENVSKWGHPHVVVTQNYPKDFMGLEGYFDLIAADVPCSGEGMFRKDKGAIDEWSLQAVAHCAERQREIIRNVWPALKEGGHLVYSTCTFNREENEDNVVYICEELGAEIVPIPIEEQWNIVGDTTGRNLSVYHFLPGMAQGEGFFCCLLRKISPSCVGKGLRKAATKNVPSVQGASQIAPWLSNAADYKLLPFTEERVCAVNKNAIADITLLSHYLKLLQAGIVVAERKGKKWQPRTELALSLAFNQAAFPYVNLDKTTALTYLRRESIAVDAPKGYVVVGYEGLPLGFVNNLGTRANNLYPNEWRIRKSLS